MLFDTQLLEKLSKPMPKNNTTIDVQIHDDRWQAHLDGFPLEKIIDMATDVEQCDNFELSVCFTNDVEIQELNKNYRGKDKPTNVLSFPNEPLLNNPDRQVLLGDLILSIDTIEKEAKEQEKEFKDHLSHLIIHGFLHLLGYDHVDEDQAQAMESKEIKILSMLEIDNPYEVKEKC